MDDHLSNRLRPAEYKLPRRTRVFRETLMKTPDVFQLRDYQTIKNILLNATKYHTCSASSAIFQSTQTAFRSSLKIIGRQMCVFPVKPTRSSRGRVKAQETESAFESHSNLTTFRVLCEKCVQNLL